MLFNLAIDKSGTGQLWSKEADWQQIGFGGPDPRTDFRSGGIFSLLCLIYFVKYYPEHLEHILKQSAVVKEANSQSDFLLAIVSINVTSRLMSYLHMNSAK